ncbi:MAG: ATP-dependent zinc metalloprotease FtsH [Candidatus Latescibacteria bacterium]|nr:ATP-dependent zinc metalloprotease FtsH [Candidatus Latescibacterota bacterium]
MLSNFIIWILIFLVAWTAWNFLVVRRGTKAAIEYSQFIKELDDNNIKSVTISEKEITGTLNQEATLPGEKKPYKDFKTYIPFEDPDLINRLLGQNVAVLAKPSSPWTSILVSAIPWLLFIGIWIFFIRRMSQGSNQAFSFGKSRARLLATDRPKTTFEDVAGVDEAKEELKEVIEFLKAPQKFQKLGGKIPKGVLLVGPTGTGKTLLARAVAGEAGVPFLSISGSDFVEMFVGVGAARVRDLFEQGKRNAPCIIFIDEIDAVGRQRGAGLGGGHDEREQTLNQLLVEMDGFDTQEGVIIMAATNRPDILDQALLRPGRFDRQIMVDRPDVIGREGILKVHTRKIPVAKNIDLKILARGTPGFSGADLANMVNEAALLAARRNKVSVEMKDFEDAKDKVLMGVERKSLFISEQEKTWIAYHEAGHTLVSKLVPGTDPIHKVTIIPRGQALGVTQQLPIDDRKIYPKTYCVNQLTVMLGGRAAEELQFNDTSTGARDDINRATILARKMVCEWGMSTKMGPVTLGKQDEEIFLGREMGLHRNFSNETAQLIDSEIKKFVDDAYKNAKRLLKDNFDKLKSLAQKLLEKEILDGKEIDEIIGISTEPATEAK